jgi:hypothetical protein
MPKWSKHSLKGTMLVLEHPRALQILSQIFLCAQGENFGNWTKPNDQVVQAQPQGHHACLRASKSSSNILNEPNINFFISFSTLVKYYYFLFFDSLFVINR